jgi:hypothetical protein
MKENMNPDPGCAKGSAEAGGAKLSALLRQGRVSPALPPRFQENVWQRIEANAVPAKADSWLDALAVLMLRPRFAYATVVALVLAGSLLGVHQGARVAKQDAQARYVAMVAPNALR